jgi:hypothetical protein
MAVANGFGKVVTSGSVFMYDTGDTFNSYKGQPGTNITTGAGRNYNGYSKTTYSPGEFFETNGYTEVVNIPALGPTTVQSIEINNSAPGVACCPNLYNYTGGWNSPIWTPGQTYSYQIIYKCRSGYTNPNFMYHYEYNSSGGYLTEYGVFTTDKQESLGDGWYHAWNTFTAQPTAALGYTGLWYYQYYVADKLSIAAVSISPGDTIRPPRQIIPSGTTRTATQGLLPIVGNSSINLSNVSFTSNAQMTFDGTDDTVPITTNLTLGSNFSMEAIIYRDTATNGDILSSFNNPFIFLWRITNTGQQLLAWNGGGGSNTVTSTTVTGTGAYKHVVTTYDGTSVKFFTNGILTDTFSKTFSLSNFTALQLGSTTYDNIYFDGSIPIAKIYNRALSSSEVQQNYNKYKTRFNLP